MLGRSEPGPPDEVPLTEEPPLGEVDPGQQARCWVLMKNVPNPEMQS